MENEINSVDDNPIVDVDNQKIVHGGNFHGDYISLEMDKLKIAITKLTMLTERQLNDWGCKYTRIETQKKPSFDLFIDDKSIKIEDLLMNKKKVFGLLGLGALIAFINLLLGTLFIKFV